MNHVPILKKGGGFVVVSNNCGELGEIHGAGEHCKICRPFEEEQSNRLRKVTGHINIWADTEPKPLPIKFQIPIFIGIGSGRKKLGIAKNSKNRNQDALFY